jgi:hypothetical protein
LSRFSPTVMPRRSPGGDPSEDLARAIEEFQLTRRRQKLDQQADEDRTEGQEERRTLRERREVTWGREDEAHDRGQVRDELADHEAGIRRGRAPNPLADAIGQVGQMGRGQVPLPFGDRQQPDLQRATDRTGELRQLSPDRYFDRAQSPEERSRRTADSERSAFVDSFVQAGGPRNAGELVGRQPELAERYLFPEATEWKPGTKEEAFELEARRRSRTGSGDDDGPITRQAATDRIIEMYSPLNPVFGTQGDLTLDPEQVAEYADYWATHGRLPENMPPRVPPEPEVPERQGFRGMVGDWLGNVFGAGDDAAGGGRPSASSDPGGDTTATGQRSVSGGVSSPAAPARPELDALAQQFTGPEWTIVRDQDLQEALSAEGLQEDEIEYVLRARRRSQ